MALDLTCPAGHAFTVDEPPEKGSTSCPQCGQEVSVTPYALETCAWTPAPRQSPAAAAAPTSDQRIGRFVLRAKVGEGATGIVFRAHDPSLDREVALKVPRAGLLNDAEDVAAFLREGLAAGKLRHPHIVPVYEAGQADGYCYIASAFIDGQTLKSAIETRGPFRSSEAAELVARVAKALHYAHGKGIVHRDVKPGNIMLDAAGEPQIMDFGLAHRVTGETLQTIDGALVGTPAYMSPEQAAGRSREVDARSDLWSLGVVLYELLTGQRPFGGTAAQWIAAIQHREPVSPRKLDRSMPRDLETICLKCLAKSPAQRYPTCEALAEDLGRFLRGEPIVARPVSRLERTIRWCRRQPVLASAIAAASVFLIAAATVGGYHLAFRSEASERANRLTADLGTKEQQFQSAQSKATQQQQRADAEFRAKQRQVCENKLVRALELCEAGEIDHGLLVMASALADAISAGAEDLEHVLRLNLSAWMPSLATLEQIVQQDSEVVEGEFSSDGKRLLTCGEFHCVWDLNSGNLVAKTIERDTKPWWVVWEPGENSFLSGSSQRVARWDIANGQSLWTIGKANRGEWGLALGPDRRRVLSWVTFGKTAELWDTMTGQRVTQLLHPDIVSGAISPDGNTVVTGGFLGADVKFWNADTGEALPIGINSGIQPIHMQFADEGRKLLVCGGRMQLYDATSGQAAGKLIDTGRSARAFSDYGVSLSSDGRVVAIRDSDNRARLLNTESGMLLGSPLAHGGPVHRVTFRSDNRRLLTSSADGTARLWDVNRTTSIGQPLRHGVPVRAIRFETGSSRFITGDRDGTVRVWREPAQAADSGIRLAGFPSAAFAQTAKPPGRSVYVTSNGRVIAVVWQERLYSIRVWNALTGHELCRFEPYKQSFTTTDGLFLAVSRDAQRFAVRWHDPTTADAIRIRQAMIDTGVETGGQIVLSRKVYRDAHLEFSPDGGSLLACTDTQATLIDSLTGETQDMRLPPGSLPRQFSPDGSALLCYASQGAIELRRWADSNGPFERVGLPIPLREPAHQFCFSRDGQVLAALTTGGLHQSWSTATAQPLGRPTQHPAGGVALALNSSGTLLAVSDSAGGVALHNPATGHVVGRPLRGHDDVPGGRAESVCAQALAFSDDGTELFACFSDGVLRRWRVPQPATRAAEDLANEIAVRTGTVLSADGVPLVLDLEAWKSRRQMLADARGVPLSDLFAGESQVVASQEPILATPSIARDAEHQSEEVWQGLVRAPEMRAAKLLHEDEFNDPASGFRVAGNAKYKSTSFYRDGRFIIRSDKKNRCVRSSPWSVQDFACRVQGRSVGSEQSYWELHLTPGVTGQFLQVRVIADGSAQVRLSHSSSELLTVGPLFHPVIKRGEEFNELLVILHDNELRIYVNGAAIADPIRPSFTIPAGKIMLTGGTDTSARAEFERIDVWDADSIALQAKP
jgi:WD40 repeat protein